MTALLPLLEKRWAEIFSRLAEAQDCPPGLRLRTEGIMEATLLIGEASESEIDAAMVRAYEQAFGRLFRDDFGADWRSFYPFPQIPGHMRRAPVFPSTPE